MTPTERAALRALAEKATPGPWEAESGYKSPDVVTPTGLVVAVTIASDMKPHADKANAAYIAAAHPQAVLALLDEVERLREALIEIAHLPQAPSLSRAGYGDGYNAALDTCADIAMTALDGTP